MKKELFEKFSGSFKNEADLDEELEEEGLSPEEVEEKYFNEEEN